LAGAAALAGTAGPGQARAGVSASRARVSASRARVSASRARVSPSRARVSPSRAHEIVVEKSAANRAVARRDARRRLALFDSLPGAVPHRRRPSGIDGTLRAQGPIPGDSRQVHAFGFITVPGSPRSVHRWLRRHPPRGSAAWENESDLIFWEHGPRGTRGATAVVRAVPRAGGGSVVRIDIYDSWELPRSPAARIPAGAHYVSLTISPSGGIVIGEKPRPTRRTGTTESRLIASLERIVDTAPAFQLYRAPSCGPETFGKSHDFEFVFKTRPRGRTLARVSQEAPIGLCDALELAVGRQRRPFTLEGGGTLLGRAHGLIRRARPRAGPGA
jgi:hypothetical protein